LSTIQKSFGRNWNKCYLSNESGRIQLKTNYILFGGWPARLNPERIFYFMIGKIVTINGWAPVNHFIILDKVLANNGYGKVITMYLCQLQQKDGVGTLTLADPKDISFPFIPKQ